MHSLSKLKIWFTPLLFALSSLTCSMPGISSPTTETPPLGSDVEITREEIPVGPTSPPPPTPTPQSLPPALVEVDPPLGSDLPLQGSFTFYFNQPMDKPSVEIALTGEPALSGRFNWIDDATVRFELDAPFLPDTNLNIHIDTSALAKNGLFLQEPIHLQYHTASPIKVTQLMPKPGAVDVDSTSAIAAAFNQPIIPAGSDSSAFPAAFSIEPALPGNGKWVNASTYIFYPEQALTGGENYTVYLNAGLESITGGPFEGRENFESDPFSWSFSTAKPRIASIYPGDGATEVHLDSVFKVEFHQPMDITSTEDNFIIYDGEQKPVAGQHDWNEDFTTLTFTPTSLLSNDTNYTLVLLGAFESVGRTPLGFDHVAKFHTAPKLKISSTEPKDEGLKQPNSNLVIHFNGPAEMEKPLAHIAFTPTVSNLTHSWGELGRTLYINGDFQPITAYRVTVSSDFPDPWGKKLGSQYMFSFQTSPLDHTFSINHGEAALFLTPEDSTLPAQAANINAIDIRLGEVPIEDFLRIQLPGESDSFQKYTPLDQRNWTYTADAAGDRIYSIQLPVTPNGEGLIPGIYHLDYTVPDLPSQPPPYLLISSNVQLLFKLSTTSAFVWAIDLRTNQPVSGVPVAVYNSAGERLTSGPTDTQGVFQSPITTQPDLYTTYYAVMTEPGDEYFSLSLSHWDQGIEGNSFGFSTEFTAPEVKVYLYTDRPVYYPGETVHFRGVVRHEHNGRYALPDLDLVPITIYNVHNRSDSSLELSLSEFGTIHGEFLIPEDALPGLYKIAGFDDFITFQVAQYHETEINLSLNTKTDATAGESVTAELEANYPFGAPVANRPVSWRIFKSPFSFELPGYQVGINTYPWLKAPWEVQTAALEETIAAGDAITNQEGGLSINFLTDADVNTPQAYKIEAAMMDNSGFPVSTQTSVFVHPSNFYIGVRPDTWVGQANEEVGFEILTMDWTKAPAGGKELLARFRKVSWTRETSLDPFSYPTFVPQYSPVFSADLRTSQDGRARLVFTPPEAGTYQLDVSGEGTQTQVLIWVGGTGLPSWPDLPNNRIHLTADKASYLPGDTAQIFIPNPFKEGAQALITVERDEVLRYDVFNITAPEYNYQLSLTDLDAPNVYVSITLIGRDAKGKPDFRQGYLNLQVKPVSQQLEVVLSTTASGREGDILGGSSFGTSEEVNLKIHVTDHLDNPVQGEFSLAVVDLPSMKFANSNAVDIFSAFYGNQPIGIRTGISLAVHARRRISIPGGLGNREEQSQDKIINQDIPLTAVWRADIVTDHNGEADIAFSPPSNQVTWKVDVRGLTANTLVGQTQNQFTTNIDLQIRPIVPSFLVAGDHVQLGAIVQNNSGADLVTNVSLQGVGFRLDEVSSETQRVTIPVGSRTQIAWWGTVEDVPSLDLIFSVKGGQYQDAARIAETDTPVLRFTALQSSSASGILDLEAERLEVISLPRTFDPTGGTLRVHLAPSLAAAMVPGLNILEYHPYACTEQTLSRFLPNLIAYRAIQRMGLDSPDFANRLERTLGEGISKLAALQNDDGGWAWWPLQNSTYPTGIGPFQESDSYISAYVVYGLAKARSLGAFVDDAVIERGRDYILATLPAIGMVSSNSQLDQLAFQYMALAQIDPTMAGAARNLFDVRDQLSPYAKAFLIWTLNHFDPEDTRIDALLSDLKAEALHGEAGVHWEGKNAAANLDTPIFNTAAVISTISKNDPASRLIPEALRYLMSHRRDDGSHGSTYETAWTLMAFTEIMKGTGELAGDFSFSASLNGDPFLEGKAGVDTRLNPVSSSLPLSELHTERPNGLSIQRSEGPGRLYYAIHLDVNRPAADVEPYNRGISVARSYQRMDNGLQTDVGSIVTVRLSLALKNDTHFLVVEDYVPAGAKIMAASLKNTQIRSVNCGLRAENCYTPQAPFAEGWGWWLFQDPQIFEDHITWITDFIPAGTYELTYTLLLTQPGEYQVIPAQAWQFYFPEVRGNSAGDLFIIKD